MATPNTFPSISRVNVRTKRRDELQQCEGQVGGPLARLHRPPALAAVQVGGDGEGVRRAMARLPSIDSVLPSSASGRALLRIRIEVSTSRAGALVWLATQRSRRRAASGRKAISKIQCGEGKKAVGRKPSETDPFPRGRLPIRRRTPSDGSSSRPVGAVSAPRNCRRSSCCCLSVRSA
jgi:hypothetical protein